MQDFSIKPTPSIRASTGTPHGANADTLPKRPLPFTRADTTDGGRFSRARHSIANMTRELFGRQPRHAGEPANAAMAWLEPVVGDTPPPARLATMQQTRYLQEQQRLQQVRGLEQQIWQMQQRHQQIPLAQPSVAQGGSTGVRPVYEQVDHPMMQAAALQENLRQLQPGNPGYSPPIAHSPDIFTRL